MSLALILGLLLPSASIDARTYNEITTQAIGITVDADKTDWADVESLGGSTDDDDGKVGSLGELYLANDEENLYFWVDANNIPNWGEKGMYINLALNINDVDSGVAENPWGSAYNYSGMTAKPNYQLAVRIKEDIELNWYSFNQVVDGALVELSGGDTTSDGIELSLDRTVGFEGKIPLALLGLTPGDIVNPHVALTRRA